MTLDPGAIALDPTRLDDALAAIDRLWTSSACADEKETFEASDFPAAQSMADLLARYDYGEPALNGSLNLLARHLIAAPPAALSVTSFEKIPEIECEFISRFHHGDVTVTGDLGAFDSVWITGDLAVSGVIDASWLDSFADLLVGGNLECEAIQFMGLSMIAGTLTVRRFAHVNSQGLNLVLGGVGGPILLGEHESTSGWDASKVSHHLDISDIDMSALAGILGVPVDPGEEHTFEVVLRALDAARSTR